MSATATVEGVEYYMFVVDGLESFNMILNNGSGAQTGDITNITATTFFSYDGGSGYKVLTDITAPDPTPNPNPNPNPNPEPTPEPAPTGKFYAYFAAPSSWTTVKAWVWNKDNGDDNYTGGTWPGERCTKTSQTYNGMAIWKWEYNGEKTDKPTHIIFNNGSGEQTGDFIFENGMCYDRSGVNGSISVTAINGVNSTAAKAMIKVYTLNGNCVAVMPDLNAATYTLRPGIYVANGRKFVVR